jgi:hypothetical protein
MDGHLSVGKKRKPGRRKTGKITITLRVFPTTKRLLAKAARLSKRQISDYAEEALLDRLKADGHITGAILKTEESR